jgi:hypothetical protein
LLNYRRFFKLLYKLKTNFLAFLNGFCSILKRTPIPDLSLPSIKHQKAVASGTDNKAIDAAKNDRKKLTQKLTPPAFLDCNQSATVDNQQSDMKKITMTITA